MWGNICGCFYIFDIIDVFNTLQIQHSDEYFPFSDQAQLDIKAGFQNSGGHQFIVLRSSFLKKLRKFGPTKLNCAICLSFNQWFEIMQFTVFCSRLIMITMTCSGVRMAGRRALLLEYSQTCQLTKLSYLRMVTGTVNPVRGIVPRRINTVLNVTLVQQRYIEPLQVYKEGRVLLISLLTFFCAILF